jgi:hypothetical protein
MSETSILRSISTTIDSDDDADEPNTSMAILVIITEESTRNPAGNID